MKSKLEERYIFYRLATSDLEQATASLAAIGTTDSATIDTALFRDSTVAYSRPFSSNDGLLGGKPLIVPRSLVPSGDLRDLHDELLTLRNKLFAHSDLPFREPGLGRYSGMFPISLKGFYHSDFMVKVPQFRVLVETISQLLWVDIRTMEPQLKLDPQQPPEAAK